MSFCSPEVRFRRQRNVEVSAKSCGLPAKTSSNSGNKERVTVDAIGRCASSPLASRYAKSYVLPVYTKTNSESKARVIVGGIVKLAAAGSRISAIKRCSVRLMDSLRGSW